MAAGDILSCEVLATGWQAKVIIEAFKDGGTYDFGDIDASVANAKLTMTVVSEGYNASGTLGTKTRYVYGTRVCQKAYPNQATAEETESGGNVELTIALSDYVYDDDNTGAGKSGTAPTVTIASGWYTDNGTGGSSAASNAATNLAVTNSSTQDYPKVIARWAVVPYQRVVSTFDLEAVAFHRFAENGKPVACVVFSHTDATTDAVASTAMVKSSAADSLPCYQRTITASDYTDNTVYNWQFTAYPWVGDENSKLTTVGGTANDLVLGPLPLLMDSDDDYGVTYAAVNTSTGSDSGTKAFNSIASAQASPAATIRYALAQIQTYNNTNYSRNNANAGVILLQSSNHSINGTGTATTGDVWVTITRDPDVTKANAKITGAPNTTISTDRLRLYDITLEPTGYMLSGSSTRVVWCDQIALAPTVQQSQATIHSFSLIYVTHSTATKCNNPFSIFGGYSEPALIRGCAMTECGEITPGYGSPAMLTTTSDHTGSTLGTFWVPTTTNAIMAYCQDLADAISGNGLIGVSTAASDVAIVCNIVERRSGTDYAALIYGDGNVTSSTNVLLWHNSIVGERTNYGYNEGASAVTRSNHAVRNNVFQRLPTKHDVFKTDGTRTGAWSVTYGVGMRGNHVETTETSFPFYYSGIGASSGSDAGFVDDASVTGSGIGNGDYTPATGSVLIGKIATAADVVIPWDINGVAFAAGGCAGAITLAGGSILHAQHYYRLLRG